MATVTEELILLVYFNWFKLNWSHVASGYLISQETCRRKRKALVINWMYYKLVSVCITLPLDNLFEFHHHHCFSSLRAPAAAEFPKTGK